MGERLTEEVDGYKLSEVHIKATTPPTIVSYWSPNHGCENVTLYVPQGCKQAYENTTYWKYFKNIVEE